MRGARRHCRRGYFFGCCSVSGFAVPAMLFDNFKRSLFLDTVFLREIGDRKVRSRKRGRISRAALGFVICPST
ncbi:exported hypothetical protein [Rhizobium mesoamericanum STM3625]|uniref:Uncharacterized protein n=1 Tax=Rhizobium mesoamericanum STM3625 TaxID=1211777 RepID=K0PVR2_9HYPH|nr:exported hypothetical protein [Rhizobium mesoamericanum STM3625]